MTPNGKLLLEMTERQNLTIANTLDMCEGVITRERKTKDGIERSVLDYLIFCKRMVDFLKCVKIDEDRVHTLNRYVGKKKKTMRKILSDHNWFYCQSMLQFIKIPGQVRKEVFQFKGELHPK